MLRSGLIAALALLLLPASAAAATPASVTLTACVPNERRASFEARMEQVPGAERMKLRFWLEGRKPGRVWKRVPAPELRPPGETFRINAMSTYNVFEAAVHEGAGRVVLEVPAGGCRELFESVDVDALGVDPKDVGPGRGLDRVAADRTANPTDGRLQLLRPGARRIVAPHRGDQPLACDRVAGV